MADKKKKIPSTVVRGASGGRQSTIKAKGITRLDKTVGGIASGFRTHNNNAIQVTRENKQDFLHSAAARAPQRRVNHAIKMDTKIKSKKRSSQLNNAKLKGPRGPNRKRK